MNIKTLINGGGIFSKVVLGYQNIDRSYPEKLETIDNIYLENVDIRIDRTVNPFDFVYNQTKDTAAQVIEYKWREMFICNIPEPTITRFRIIRDKMKLHPEVIEKVNRCMSELEFSENTVGVHIRLTDMNAHHGDDYGHKQFSDYQTVIDRFIKEGVTGKIFIASDNHQSLAECKRIYGDRVMFIADILRARSQDDDITFQLSNFSDKRFWQDSYVEMMLLSKCKSIICRTSNVINAAIIHGDGEKLIHMI